MPELPDITLYREAIERHLGGRPLERLRIASPFLLRSVEVPPNELDGRALLGVETLGKRLVLAFEGDRFAVIHLMIAGRLRWRERSASLPRRRGLAAFDFADASLWLTEEGSKHRASLHLLRNRSSLREHDPGGIDVLSCAQEQFSAVLLEANHTLKRALTDPRKFCGIGNAYSDEILHRARLSPVRWTSRTRADEVHRLFVATRAVLEEWTVRLRQQLGDGFPEKVTAFHPDMAVHGRFGKPCPNCATPIQRIRFADHETNYCPECQTGGKLLADRSLSKLLRGDWPSTLQALEELRRQDRQPKSSGS